MKREKNSIRNKSIGSMSYVSIQKRIMALFFVCIILPVFVLGMLSYGYSSKIIHRKLIDYNHDLLEETSLSIQQEIDKIDYMTVAMFTNDTVQENFPVLNRSRNSVLQNTRALRDVEKALIQTSAAYDNIICTGLVGTNAEIKISENLPSIRLSEEEYRQVDHGQGEMIWLSTLNGKWQLTGARVLYNLNTQMPIGYIVVAYDYHAFEDILKSKKYFENGNVYLVDSNNAIIAGNIKYTPGETLDVDSRIFDKDNSIVIDNLYFVTKKVSSTGWKLVSIVPSVQFEQEIISLRSWIFVFAPVVAFLSFLLAFGISRQMLKPLKELAEVMKTVGNGNLDAHWEYSKNDEIGVIAESFDRMLSQINQLMKDSLEQERLYHNAEISALRMQINPHFIYNTLDSIKWMAQSHGDSQVVNAIGALSDYMRSTLYGPSEVSIRDEVANIQNYLLIQKFRFGDQLRFYLDFSEDILDVKVPRLILQPLVENAIIHGASKKMGIGHIDIIGKSVPGAVVLSVRDDGPGMSEEKIRQVLTSDDSLEKDSIGLYNVHRRLELHYGEGHGLIIESRIGCGLNARIQIPV